MFPIPTPTLLPTQAAPPLEIPAISAWDYTSDAIQTWNTAAAMTTLLQAIIIVGLIIFIVVKLYQMIKYFSNSETK